MCRLTDTINLTGPRATHGLSPEEERSYGDQTRAPAEDLREREEEGPDQEDRRRHPHDEDDRLAHLAEQSGQCPQTPPRGQRPQQAEPFGWLAFLGAVALFFHRSHPSAQAPYIFQNTIIVL